MKCLRCKKELPAETLCQGCKNILLPYFENTNDWHLALEIESIQQSFSRHSNVEETNLSEY